MSLAAGTKLGPYQVLSPLGAGGMGEVYRARDTRLEREVAVKVLPPHLARDPQLKQRFEREARTVSSLNHPHICTLYDIGRTGETDYLVMELVEGETLAARLERGPLSTELVLRYGAEISDALDKAHRKGIVHRDLKPGNIMLTPQAGVKVLDFGLAKSAPILGSLTALPTTPTQSGPLTAEGTLVGTFQYMAPEQFEGREADARSDIFALGAVLYEMLTARKAFPGKSQFSVASAILEKKPEPISAIQPRTPSALERVVERCLAKDAEERWQSARDVTIELKSIAGEVAAGLSRQETSDSTAPPLQTMAWAVAAVAVLAAVLLAVAYVRRAPEAPRAIRSLISAPEKVSFAFMGPPTNGGPVLSPDGSRLVFPANDAQGREALWVRPMGSLKAQRLDGTDLASFPFWSPDSRYIGFFAAGKLKKIDVLGGPAQTICDAPGGRGGTWNREDVIVFAPEVTGGLASVPAAGGTPVPVTHPGNPHATTHRWPTFLPDGRHFLYWSDNPFATDSSNVGIYVGSLGSSEQRLLLRADSNVLYAPPGYLLFLRERSLMAQAFDADKLKLQGDAFPLADLVASPQNFRLGLFSVSQNGLLVYQTGQGLLTQLTWIDAGGKHLGTALEPGLVGLPQLSPDGKRLAYMAQDLESKSVDIWLLDLTRSVRTRFTFAAGGGLTAIWSPDGSRIVFGAQRKSSVDLYIKNSSGAGSEELLYGSDATKVPDDWSRDGRYLTFDQLDPTGKTKWDIWVLPFFGDRKPFPFLQTSFNESRGVFSPDGHWLAYVSDESGTSETYLVPFPGGGGKFQISQGGGLQPVWRRDGTALFYLAGTKMMEVGLHTKGSAVEIGKAKQLFEVPTLKSNGPYSRAYTVSPDGQRFLMDIPPQASTPEPLTLVTNWTADLKK